MLAASRAARRITRPGPGRPRYPASRRPRHPNGIENMTSPPPAWPDTLPPPRDAARPYRICLVCLGNICRSQMAEAVLRAGLDRAGLAGAVVADSAGTGDWHVGGGMDRRARAELA